MTNYRIAPVKDGWAIDHDGKLTGAYATKEAAFEAAAAAASNAIKEGLDVAISVPGPETRSDSALGAK